MQIDRPTANVILVRPQIATNTGNIIRLCANAGASLHLVEPLGFTLDEPSVKRAGLDYHELTSVTVHPTLTAALTVTGTAAFGLSAQAERRYDDVDLELGTSLVFGTERSGLAPGDLGLIDRRRHIRLPMAPDNRSLNLANAVAIVVYELWRRHGFPGASSGASSGGSTSESVRHPT